MADVCDYGMTVVGPQPEIVAISRLLMPAMEYVGGPWGTIILHFSKLPIELPDVTHKWIGVQTFCLEESHSDDFSALIDVARNVGIEEAVASRWLSHTHELAGLSISGEAKWGPPVPFAEHLSAHFTGLGFRVRGTTEHTSYDDFICFNGESHPIEIKEEDILGGKTTWHVRDGRQLDPAVIESTPTE